ncbi:MAG: hypothetical protein A3E80_01970 [Chlamydiae bacterium RIFCSPHIGHO2_12_FULL_49_9]|nr:MAG: hypothetical protein A3E80_01970 [Chlamydiae bacterium RIFCSPHIGHO2_12_FULL_49_9]
MIEEISYHLQFWYRDGNPEMVDAIFEKHDAVILQNFDLLEQTGIYFYEMGQGFRALECFNKALGMNPNSASLLYFRSKILASMGEFEGACKAFSKIAERSRSTPTCYLGAHLSFLQNDFSNLITYLQSLSCEFQFSPHLRLLAKKALERIDIKLMETPSSELLEMQKYVKLLQNTPPPEITPELIESLSQEEDLEYLLSFWTRRGGSDQIAKELASALLEKINLNLKALTLLATYFYEEGDFDSALPFLSQALHFPNAPLYLHFMLTKIHILAHRFEEANRALVKLPFSLPNVYLKALLSYKKGDLSQLLALLTSVSGQIPYSNRLKKLLADTIENLSEKRKTFDERNILGGLRKLSALITISHQDVE